LEDRAVSSELLDSFALLALKDPSPVVRLYLASALQRLPLERRFGVARALVSHGEDAADADLPLLTWYGIEPLVAGHLDQALVLAREAKIDKLARFLYRRAAMEPDGRAALVHLLAEERDSARRKRVLEELATALRDERGIAEPEGWPGLVGALLADGALHDLALDLSITFGDTTVFDEVRAMVENRALAPERRQRALEGLVRGHDPRAAAVLVGQLEDAALRAAALRGLAAFADANVAHEVLARYASFSADER